MPLVDTWAWVEYLGGGPTGAKAAQTIEGPDVATSIITVAELADLHARDDRPGIDERLAFVESRGPILPISQRAARQAAETKWKQRRAGRPMGLADAIIYETAQDHDLDLLTGDPGFEGLPDVRFLESRPKSR